MTFRTSNHHHYQLAGHKYNVASFFDLILVIAFNRFRLDSQRMSNHMLLHVFPVQHTNPFLFHEGHKFHCIGNCVIVHSLQCTSIHPALQKFCFPFLINYFNLVCTFVEMNTTVLQNMKSQVFPINNQNQSFWKKILLIWMKSIMIKITPFYVPIIIPAIITQYIAL